MKNILIICILTATLFSIYSCSEKKELEIQKLPPNGGTDSTAEMSKKESSPAIEFQSRDPSINAGDIEKAEGGYTIAQIYNNRKMLDGKTISVRGKVVKVNENVMGRNWIHIQDGTGDQNSFDLTVTTQEKAGVGDTVLVSGTVSTEQDFGIGVIYRVVIDNAHVTME
jgi:hypothetical protein